MKCLSIAAQEANQNFDMSQEIWIFKGGRIFQEGYFLNRISVKKYVYPSFDLMNSLLNINKVNTIQAPNIRSYEKIQKEPKEKKEAKRMVKNSVKIAASASVILLMMTVNTIDGTKSRSRPDLQVLNSKFYIFATFFTTVMYFFVLILYVNHIHNWRRKVVISALFLCTISLILPLRFILTPPRWDIEFRLISYITMLTAIVFLLLLYLRDTNNMIVSSIIVCLLSIFVTQQSDPLKQPFITIFACSMSIVTYAVICWLYVNRAANRKWKIVTAVLFFSIFFGIILTYIFVWFSHWELFSNVLLGGDTFLLLLYVLYKRTCELLQEDRYTFLKLAELPTRFVLKDLEKATNSFHLKIGQGGSGTIFKGTLSDGSIVAVKRVKSQKNGDNEFITEITIIASLQHVNLVHLLGYCLTERGDRYLVYPFFENGSLDTWIFADEAKRRCLTWVLRYQIAVDVAKALAYLHHDCRHRILHLDVKPGNILLDDSFRARVSDFGISRSMERDEMDVMTRARGTVGYLPPEMLVPRAISPKSDVYSYGMVLLELVGGRRNFQSTIEEETHQRRNTYLPKIIRDKIKEGNLLEAVDRSLLHDGRLTESEVMLLVNVAFWCIQENPELRPDMNDVVDMLEGRKTVDVPPESPMFVVNFLDIESQYSVSQPDDSRVNRYTSNGVDTLLSANTISISVQSGR